jgi:hypothetical protein
MFYYSIQEGSIDTGYSVMAYNLDLLDNKVTSSKTSSQGSFTLNYEYITMLCVVFLILLAYVKNRYLNSIAETINRSFFLILFVLTVVAEILFKVYHMLKGTNDYVYLKQLLLKSNRNKFLLQNENGRQRAARCSKHIFSNGGLDPRDTSIILFSNRSKRQPTAAQSITSRSASPGIHRAIFLTQR